MGVPYDIFWVLTPRELEPFKKAFSFSQEFNDMNNWQLGNYIRIAIASAISDKNKYPTKPFLYEKLHEKTISDVEKEQKGKENNQLVRLMLLDRIKKRERKLAGGDKD